MRCEEYVPGDGEERQEEVEEAHAGWHWGRLGCRLLYWLRGIVSWSLAGTNNGFPLRLEIWWVGGSGIYELAFSYIRGNVPKYLGESWKAI